MALSPLERLQGSLAKEAKRASVDVTKALEELAEVHALRISGGDPIAERHAKAIQRLAAALSRLSAAADLSGRIELRAPAPASLQPEAFATHVPDVIPAVAFEEAIRDLEEREPLGAAELRRAGLEVEDVYGALTDPATGEVFYPHGFSLAKAADAEVAHQVKEKLVQGLALGHTMDQMRLALPLTWARPYAETVVRTTFNTATTAGRFVEAERVNAIGFSVGLRFSCVLDSNLRSGRPQDGGENHRALNGMVARVDDPVWDRFSPPGGFNCRCLAEVVMGDEVPEGFVTAPADARFAPGFGRKPSQRGPYS